MEFKDVKNNNKGFSKYINNRKKMKDNWAQETLVTEDTEKAKLPNEIFVLVFTGDHGKGVLKEFILVKKGWVGEHLSKSTGP